MLFLLVHHYRLTSEFTKNIVYGLNHWALIFHSSNAVVHCNRTPFILVLQLSAIYWFIYFIFIVLLSQVQRFSDSSFLPDQCFNWSRQYLLHVNFIGFRSRKKLDMGLGKVWVWSWDWALGLSKRSAGVWSWARERGFLRVSTKKHKSQVWLKIFPIAIFFFSEPNK